VLQREINDIWGICLHGQMLLMQGSDMGKKPPDFSSRTYIDQTFGKGELDVWSDKCIT
jgi:hypothetical protein